MSQPNSHFQRLFSANVNRRKAPRRPQRTLALESLEPKRLLSANQPVEPLFQNAAVEAFRVVPAVFAQSANSESLLGDREVEEIARQIQATAPSMAAGMVSVSVSSRVAAARFGALGPLAPPVFAQQAPPRPGAGGANQGPVAQPLPNAPRQEVLVCIEWGDMHEDADGKTWREGKIVEQSDTDPPERKQIGTAREETVPDKDAKGKPTGTTTTTTTETYDSGKTKVTEVIKDKKGNVIKTTTTETDTDENGNKTEKKTVEEKDKNGKTKTTTTERGTDDTGKKTVKQTVEETDKKGKTTKTTTEWKQESNGKWYKKDGDKWVEDKKGPPAP